MRVLIADDSIVSRHLLEATLRRWNYEVIVANDGSEAWGILEQPGAPSLAILDWMMPGLTGLEICRLLRKQNREPYTYVLLLTSKSLKEEVVEGMETLKALEKSGSPDGAPREKLTLEKVTIAEE